jgi:hypothetical protein
MVPVRDVCRDPEQLEKCSCSWNISSIDPGWVSGTVRLSEGPDCPAFPHPRRYIYKLKT